MSYPAQRPPLASYASDTDSSTAGGHAPLLREGYPPMPAPQPLQQPTPGLPYDVSQTPTANNSANRLRRPGWGRKDTEQGQYEELDRSPGYPARGAGSSYDFNSPVVPNPEGQEATTKARTLLLNRTVRLHPRVGRRPKKALGLPFAECRSRQGHVLIMNLHVL